jgi:hypothetical protein
MRLAEKLDWKGLIDYAIFENTNLGYTNDFRNVKISLYWR